MPYLVGFAVAYGIEHDRVFDGVGDAAAVPVLIVTSVGAVALVSGCVQRSAALRPQDGIAFARLTLLPTGLAFTPHISDLSGYFTGPSSGNVQVPLSFLLLTTSGLFALVTAVWLRPGARAALVCAVAAWLTAMLGVLISPLHFTSDRAPGFVPFGWWAALFSSSAALAAVLLVPSVRSLVWSRSDRRSRAAAVAASVVLIAAIAVGAPGLRHASEPPRFCGAGELC